MTDSTGTIEGLQPVLEALKAGRGINKILIARDKRAEEMKKIKELAREQSINIQFIERKSLGKYTTSRAHQGIVALAAPKQYTQLEEILNKGGLEWAPLLLLLDGINDPQNLGAILRVADATGCQGVVIPKHRSVMLTASVNKASAGAMEHVPVARVTNLSHTLEFLKKRGYWIVGTDPGAGSLMYEIDLTGPLAVVIGSEGRGISSRVVSLCDFLVRLPMYGKTSSLNAAVATAVLLYEVVRQRHVANEKGIL